MENNKNVSLAKRVLIFGLLAGFLIMGFLALQRAMPEPKEDRIYQEFKKYSPYKLEKRLGGLTIVDTRDNTKEKPNASDVLLRMDELEKNWGKTHITIENNSTLSIKKDDNTTAKIEIKNNKELIFIKKFFGI